MICKVKNTIDKYGLFSCVKSVAVGVSGGADSMCLLNILSKLKDEYSIILKAVHINHNLRGDEALRDENFVRAAMEKAKELAENGADIILIDAPLLFESGFDSFCACTVCVTAPEETVIRRIMRRDGISKEDAGKRLAVQKPAAELREKSDFEIVNDADRETILERVEAAAEKIRSLYIKTEK